jgi:hypothetical protein
LNIIFTRTNPEKSVAWVNSTVWVDMVAIAESGFGFVQGGGKEETAVLFRIAPEITL